MDDSISPESHSDNHGTLPVAIGTLEIEGVRPSVGDVVRLKVMGNITKIVNETAWVKPSTINDSPMASETPDASEDELIKSASAFDRMI